MQWRHGRHHVSSPELLETVILTPKKTKEKRGEVEKLTANPPRSLVLTEREQGTIAVAADWAQARRDLELNETCGIWL